MKATGIVRRIDDLGRVVIPKEIRRSFHLETFLYGSTIFSKGISFVQYVDNTWVYHTYV